MANTNKPNGCTHHINISYFVLQELVQQGKVNLAHIHRVVNPPDALTKAIEWALYCCHIMQMMGHVGTVSTSASGRI
eukprot:6775076-Ditylum_brightwellii.AAC.1